MRAHQHLGLLGSIALLSILIPFRVLASVAVDGVGTDLRLLDDG